MFNRVPELFSRLIDSSGFMVVFFILIGLCVYSQAFSFPFIHDDFYLIVHNSDIGRWDNLGQFFYQQLFQFSSSSIVSPYFRPFVEVFNRLQYMLFGLNSWGYHSVNVFLHLTNGLLLWQLLKKLQQSSLQAWMIAFIFLIHPVQVQSVAAIAGNSTLLATMFIFLGLNQYISFRRGGRFLCLVGSFICFLFSLGTKENSIVFPLGLFLVDWYLNTIKLPRRSNIFHVIVWLVVFVFVAWRANVANMMIVESGSTTELMYRLLCLPQILMTYVQLVIFPVELHYYHVINSLYPSIIGWGALGILIFIVVVVGRLFRNKEKEIIFGLGWFICFIFPMLHIMPIIAEFYYLSVADHFLYIPMIGLVFVLVNIVFDLGGKVMGRYKNYLVVAGFFVVILLGVLSFHQTQYWKSEIAVFSRSAYFEPQLGRVQQQLGNAYWKNKQLLKAEVHYLKALSIFSQYAVQTNNDNVKALYRDYMRSVYLNLGNIAMAKGDFSGVIHNLSTALSIDQVFSSIADGDVFRNLAVAYAILGNTDQAEYNFMKALQRMPDNLQIYMDLAQLKINSGDLEEAKRWIYKALKKDSQYQPAHDKLLPLVGEPFQ